MVGWEGDPEEEDPVVVGGQEEGDPEEEDQEEEDPVVVGNKEENDPVEECPVVEDLVAEGLLLIEMKETKNYTKCSLTSFRAHYVTLN